MTAKRTHLLLTSKPFKVDGYDHCEFIMRWFTCTSRMRAVVDGKKNPYARSKIINAECIQQVEGLKKKMIKLLGRCSKCDREVPNSTPGCKHCKYRVGHNNDDDNNDDDNNDDDNNDDDNGGDEDRDDDEHDESNNKDKDDNEDEGKIDNDANTYSDNDVRSNQSETGSVYKGESHTERGMINLLEGLGSEWEDGEKPMP